MDTDVISVEALHKYTAALERTGLFGPDSWYMNHGCNLAFAVRALNGGKFALPVLFQHAEYDYLCETMASHLADPMRQDCTDLTEATIASGHWMAQESRLLSTPHWSNG